MDDDVGGEDTHQDAQQHHQHPLLDDPEVVRPAGGELCPASNSTTNSDNLVKTYDKQSTSSLTVKLNKLNCQSVSSDEPRPGPSNSAADFDLEVIKLDLLGTLPSHLCSI